MDGKIVAERFQTGQDISIEYFVLDHLGSVAVITDASGNVLTDGNGHEIGRLAYDAWGKRRNAGDWSDDATCSTPPAASGANGVTRGFTGHEEMDSVCLVNANARLYDPTTGRFLSPDSFTENQYDLQTLNRYTYVGNNPLSLTDPTGHFAFGLFLMIAAVVAVFEPMYEQYPLFGSIMTVAASLACGPGAAACAAGAASMASGEITGLTGGSLGDVLKAAALTFAQSYGLARIGMTNWSLPEKAVASGLVGGITSVAGGGRFGAGFLAAGAGSLTGPVIGEPPGTFSAKGLLLSSVLGGATSMLGGGKFANGAVTAAFAYVATSLDSRSSVTTGDTSGEDPPPGAPHVVPKLDMVHPFRTEEQALDAAQISIDQAGQATRYQWEYANFTVKVGDLFYNTFTETSNWSHGVVWDNTKAFMSEYDVLEYSHLHVIPALGFGFSTADKIAYGKWMTWGSPHFHGFYLETKFGSIWRLTNTSGAENRCTLGQLVGC